MKTQMAKNKPGPKPNANRARDAVVNVRARHEWKEWIEAFAEHEKLDVSEVIAEAMSVFARERSFRMPPQR